MSKDQAIGGAILVVCVLVAIGYVIGLFFYQPLIDAFPMLEIASPETVRYWFVAIPVFVAFIAILLIGAWIGWTMATTPPPKPIEEITTEMEDNSSAATDESTKK
ncbi:MAG: hypothetical protein NWF04_08340 [Candidatus Bathyarchaeota archaeon]|nr:hypothetical protein [Candidatus Bathyarchaeota archaeon]